MFKTYDIEVKKLLFTKSSSADWKSILENHKVMILRIQHERPIHLMVTIFVGIVMSASAFVTIITKELYLLIFCIPLLFLFLGYLFHYRFLENTTQNWYLLEDQIKKIPSL